VNNGQTVSGLKAQPHTGDGMRARHGQTSHEKKSAGSSAGGTDIARAPLKLSPEGPGTKVHSAADVRRCGRATIS